MVNNSKAFLNFPSLLLFLFIANNLCMGDVLSNKQAFINVWRSETFVSCRPIHAYIIKRPIIGIHIIK